MSGKAGLVSIVIPTFNRSRLVTRAIASALRQTYSPIEVIVVDDGSADGTSELLAVYALDQRIRLIKHSHNRGALAAKNSGFDAVSGEFTTVLDSDDELLPEALSVLVAKLQSLGPAFGMVFGNCIDPNCNERTGRGLPSDCEVTYEDALRGKFQGEFFGIWRTSVLGSLRFDESLLGGTESNVWHRLYRQTRVWYVDATLRYYYRNNPDSVSRVTFGKDQLLARARSYSSYIDIFGKDLIKVSRPRFARLVQYEGYWALLAGERRWAGRKLFSAFRASPGFVSAFLCLGVLVPVPVLKRVVMWRTTRK